MSKYQELAEICEILDSKRVPIREDCRFTGDYPYYGANGLQGYIDRYIFDDELVLLAEDGGYFGSKEKPIAYRVSGKCWVNNHAHVLKPKEYIDVDYLCYSLMYYDVSKLITGTTRAKLTQGAMRKMLIPVPLLERQKEIAELLDKASALIEKRKEQLAELDRLAESVFYDMFGDPVTNPKGWKKGKIGDICKSVNYGTSSPASINGRYKYLRMNNITYGGDLDLGDLKYIDVAEKDFEKYVVRKGDLLFNRTNSKDLVGKTTYFNSDEDMIIAGYIIRVRITDNMLPVFVSKYLNTSYMKIHLRGLCKSIIGQANINAKELQSIPIYFPPMELQQQFASIIETIDIQKAKVKEALKESEDLFQRLMQDLFKPIEN